MADEETKPPIVQPVFLDPQSQVRAEQQAIAEASAEAERKQLDESKFPGGRFRRADGVYVDAEGKPHKDQKSA